MIHQIYEIEHKYLVDLSESDYLSYPYDRIEQAYICTSPVIRIRRKNDTYILTVKGEGMVKHLEYELPLTREQYESLRQKTDGHVIKKRRYRIPYFYSDKEYIIELDIFEGAFEGLVLAEVEFACEEDAASFTAPKWFLQNVSHDIRYHNSYLSQSGNLTGEIF